jgi:hypothetical protein
MQMSEVISLREKVAQAELVVKLENNDVVKVAASKPESFRLRRSRLKNKS